MNKKEVEMRSRREQATTAHQVLVDQFRAHCVAGKYQYVNGAVVYVDSGTTSFEDYVRSFEERYRRSVDRG